MQYSLRQRCIHSRCNKTYAASHVQPSSGVACAAASRVLHCAPSSSSHIVACSRNFTIRQARSGYEPSLAVIEQLCSEYSAGWDEKQIQDEVSREFSQVLVAVDAGTDEPLGYIVGWLIAGELQILELAVHPVHRSQGIGTALLGALLQKCRCPEGVDAVLEVKAGNFKAIKLYEQHGFVGVGIRRKYYADGSDAVLMSRAG